MATLSTTSSVSALMLSADNQSDACRASDLLHEAAAAIERARTLIESIEGTSSSYPATCEQINMALVAIRSGEISEAESILDGLICHAEVEETVDDESEDDE